MTFPAELRNSYLKSVEFPKDSWSSSSSSSASWTVTQRAPSHDDVRGSPGSSPVEVILAEDDNVVAVLLLRPEDDPPVVVPTLGLLCG